MEGREQQLLHQRSYNRRVEVDPAALYSVAGFTHVERSDFFPNLSFPNVERDGG